MQSLPWLSLVLAAASLALMLRFPAVARIVFLIVGTLVFAGMLAVSGADRALAPLIMLVFAAALLLRSEPATATRSVSSRVAPRRGNRGRAPVTTTARLQRTTRSTRGTRSSQRLATPGGFDDIDVPGYEVLERVGSGGMASVYRARRRSDGQIVALKLPMAQYVADAKFIRRFHREAEVAQRLDHVNIVRTFEHGSHGVKHFMAMEFVDGRSLESYIDSRELDVELSAEIMKYVASALQHIHEQGIIHRDIKPANIMLLKGGIRKGNGSRLEPDAVKLMDFGIAGGKVLSRLTMTGARVGTPVYMSPEQARGLRIDHRSDIYSLGLVFYEILTGETAFKGGYEAIVHQQIFQTPAPPRQLNLKIGRELDDMVMRMLSKEPAERPSLAEVIEFLDSGDFGDQEIPVLSNRLIITVGSKQGVVRILDPAGNLHTSLGDIGLGPREFSSAPVAVAAAPDGHIYAVVVEYRAGQTDHRMIRKLDQNGDLVLAFGRYGMKPGEFLQPVALAVAPDGSLYTLDSETMLVQRFDDQGNFELGFGGPGEGRGSFGDPRHLTVGPDGDVFVLDAGNRQVQKFSSDGTYVTRWAFRTSAESAEFRELDGLAVDGSGNVYIADAASGKIRCISPESRVIRTYAYEPRQGENRDGLIDLGVDGEGFLYAGRRGGHLIRKFAPDGTLFATIETYAPLVQMVVDHTPAD